MRTLRPFLIAGAAILALSLLPSRALALSSVITDCNAHTKLTQHYTIAELRNALATMPADVKEYTSCYQIIQTQLYHQLGKPVPGSSGSSSGNSFISAPLLIAIIVIVVLGGALAYAAWRRGDGGGPGGGGQGPPAAPAG
ncbi:MAG TPA: hypothetical protein VFP55_06710 [Solirubrobacteraceae bacterium]|nr:hypothetical protein [Solirubrobacteraceae bacterium]